MTAALKPRFQVIDTDIVKFGPQLVRLLGIDAPEKGQTCDYGAWRPGPLAKQALERFIAGRPVSRRQIDYNHRYNHPAAHCFTGEDDLRAIMLSAGWAWALMRDTDRYAPEERDAKVGKLGVHGHRCQPPWEWRARERGDKMIYWALVIVMGAVGIVLLIALMGFVARWRAKRSGPPRRKYRLVVD